jgi:aminomethyltransferase
MTQQTVLNAVHRQLGARMVDFGGWDMPIHYGSQMEEHHAVRKDAGMFDVSHMAVIDLRGDHVRSYLRYLLANNVDKLKKPGKALYTCMLNKAGGIIDDLIVYFMSESFFRVVVNAATRDKDLAWMKSQAVAFGVELIERRDLAMVAIQGPHARARVHELFSEQEKTKLEKLTKFSAEDLGSCFVARTGYTGEDGYEIVMPFDTALRFWHQLHVSGVRACGLGARDTLRLEAGMSLYGQDMDENTTPFESGLSWTVALDPVERDFLGRQALEAQKRTGPSWQMLGLLMDDKGVLRHGQRVITEVGDGVVLSGTFSPTLGKSIALARVPTGELGHVRVDIRNREISMRVVKPPFVRDGKACI